MTKENGLVWWPKKIAFSEAAQDGPLHPRKTKNNTKSSDQVQGLAVGKTKSTTGRPIAPTSETYRSKCRV